MKKNINIRSLTAMILLTSSTLALSAQTEQQKLLERIDTVNKLIKQASNTNGLWRETKNLSDSAKKYAEAENYNLANKYLTEAEFQAKQGIQQAKDQLDINLLVPRYLQN